MNNAIRLLAVILFAAAPFARAETEAGVCVNCSKAKADPLKEVAVFAQTSPLEECSVTVYPHDEKEKPVTAFFALAKREDGQVVYEAVVGGLSFRLQHNFGRKIEGSERYDLYRLREEREFREKTKDNEDALASWSSAREAAIEEKLAKVAPSERAETRRWLEFSASERFLAPHRRIAAPDRREPKGQVLFTADGKGISRPVILEYMLEDTSGRPRHFDSERAMLEALLKQSNGATTLLERYGFSGLGEPTFSLACGAEG